MYIRKTQIQKKKAGGHYYTYRIVESLRIGKKVNQHTLLNLGAEFSFPKEQWPILIKRIQEILYGQQSLLEIDKEIEKWAQNYAARIIAKQQEGESNNGLDYREIDVDSVEMNRARSIGCEHVILEALRLLEIDTKLSKLGFTAPWAALAIGSIVGRACHPASERETHRWLADQSGLGELLGRNFEDVVGLHKTYQVSDLLFKNKSAIEEHLYRKERDVFSLGETITLYDLTNTYFEGRGLVNSLAKHGHSKEKRSDCPLVTLALVLDSSGFPKRSHVFEGNVSEASTLEKMINELQSTGISTVQKTTVVMDAGIATQEIIDWLKEHHYPYLVVSRKKHREFDEAESTIVKQDEECTVKVQKVIDEETGETLLYCHSSQREKKERAIGNRFTTRFEEALQHLHDGLSIKRRVKRYDKVIEKIGRLKQKFSKAAKLYTVTVTKDEKSGNAGKIT